MHALALLQDVLSGKSEMKNRSSSQFKSLPSKYYLNCVRRSIFGVARYSQLKLMNSTYEETHLNEHKTKILNRM